MARAGLFFAFAVLSLAALLATGCASQPAPNPTPEGQVVVNQFAGAAILSADCLDRDYISDTADYIIEGTVKRVRTWFGLNDERGFIFAYTDLSIEEYVKGTPFKENKLRIVTPVTEVKWLGMWAEEHQPTFRTGRKVRIFLKERNGEFSIVCGPCGVEEIQSPLEPERDQGRRITIFLEPESQSQCACQPEEPPRNSINHDC